MFSRPKVKVAFSFVITSNAASTAQKIVNNVGTKFFENAVFKSKSIFTVEKNFNVTLAQSLHKK